ncbi:MAG: hypothetical protein IKP43_06880 [Bacteroidaceae bacterium]|nr:hypothetical protein [Bacteroidaceae bacterium]
MTTLQLNEEVLRNISIIADDESMLRRVAKYLRKLIAEKQDSSDSMTQEELQAKIEQADIDFRQGKTFAMLPGESFMDFRKRIGR